MSTIHPPTFVVWLSRALLAPALLTAFLAAPPPAAAAGAGCATGTAPGELQVTISYGGMEALFQEIYLDGPMRVTIYEGYAPDDRGFVLTGLAPGYYDLMRFKRYDDGSYPESTTRVLSGCLVNGSVATPPPTPTPSPAGGAAQLRVPALVGFPFSFAAEQLAGFRNVDFVYADSTAPRRDVIAQSIRAGRLVDVGTRLVVTLSSGVAPAAVPPSTPPVSPPAPVESPASPTPDVATDLAPPPSSGAPSDPLQGGVSLPQPPSSATEGTTTAPYLFAMATLPIGLLLVIAARRRRR